MIPNPLWVGPWVFRFLRPEDRPNKKCRYLLYRKTSTGFDTRELYEPIRELSNDIKATSIVEIYDWSKKDYIDIYKE